LALATAVAALSACGSDGGAERNVDAGGGGSGGTGANAGYEGNGGAGGAGAPSLDGTSGLADNPVGQLLANPQRNPFDFLGDAEGARGYAEAATTCYAATDSCGGAVCEAFASCCVSTGHCCQPIDDPSLPAVLDFEQCQGLTVGSCAAAAGSSATTFGPLEPVIGGRGLVPNGTATSDGGVVVGGVTNLATQLLRIDVRFALPIGCNGTCLESAGVSFTASNPGVFVDAEVGLLLSGSRETVSLMIGGEVADTFDAGTDATRWSLSISPEGSVKVLRDDASQGSYSFDSRALTEARLVLYGRNLNAEPNNAAIASLSIESELCDNPPAWESRTPLSIRLDGDEAPGHGLGHAPSIEEHGATARIAYEVDGEIFVAAQSAPGVADLLSLEPALVPTEPYEALGIADPELVSDGSFLFLFYTARDESGAGSIGVAVSTEDPSVFTKSDGPILAPSEDVVSFDAPSVRYRDGLWLLVARATLGGGATELRAYYTSDLDTGWARVVNGGLEKLTRTDDPTTEVTGPSLIVHNSAYQLYYARREGTRWSVEIAVSDELLVWRSMGEVLGPSDEGFDSLGARDPDAISGPDRIDIVYSGQDGVSFRLGTAWRPAPSDTATSNF
jgi:predicted GH43/DUF377 family glycosyl hydrolase